MNYIRTHSTINLSSWASDTISRKYDKNYE